MLWHTWQEKPMCMKIGREYLCPIHMNTTAVYRSVCVKMLQHVRVLKVFQCVEVCARVCQRGPCCCSWGSAQALPYSTKSHPTLFDTIPNLTKPYQTLPQDCKGNPGGQRASPGADFTKPTLKWALLQPAPPYTWDLGGRPIVFTCVRSSDAHTICTYCTATVKVEEYIVERRHLIHPPVTLLTRAIGRITS